MKCKFIHMSDARGKINGAVASKNRNGNYFRVKVKPVNPQSSAQSVSRGVLKSFAQAWRGLTEAQRTAWNSLAKSLPKQNSLGETIFTTGLQTYIGMNKVLTLIGEATIEAAPIIAPSPILTNLSINIEGTPDELHVKSTDSLASGEAIVIEATKPLSAGKNFVKSEFRFITSDDTSGAVDVDITTAYTAVFGALPQAGEKVFARAYVVAKAFPLCRAKVVSNGYIPS